MWRRRKALSQEEFFLCEILLCVLIFFYHASSVPFTLPVFLKFAILVMKLVLFGWECDQRLSMASWETMNQGCLWKMCYISIVKEISSFNPLTYVGDQKKINRHFISYFGILVIIHYLNLQNNLNLSKLSQRWCSILNNVLQRYQALNFGPVNVTLYEKNVLADVITLKISR